MPKLYCGDFVKELISNEFSHMFHAENNSNTLNYTGKLNVDDVEESGQGGSNQIKPGVLSLDRTSNQPNISSSNPDLDDIIKLCIVLPIFAGQAVSC